MKQANGRSNNVHLSLLRSAEAASQGWENRRISLESSIRKLQPEVEILAILGDKQPRVTRNPISVLRQLQLFYVYTNAEQHLSQSDKVKEHLL